jgi:hypothetical protein
MERWTAGWLVAGALLSSACVTPVVTGQGTRVTRQGWALLPMQNHSETPQADERVRAMLTTVLQVRGLEGVREAPRPRTDPFPELDEARRAAAALAWAKEAGLTIGITGSVNEWRYRGAPEGWPAVGLSLSVIELKTGRILWTASGALAGGPGDTASGTAQRLLGRLLDTLELE